MNTRLKSLVKSCDMICDQKEYTLKVLQHSQKDAHERVAIDVAKLSLFQEDVDLINQ